MRHAVDNGQIGRRGSKMVSNRIRQRVGGRELSRPQRRATQEKENPMSLLRAVFAVLGSGDRAIWSTRNLIAATDENLAVELACFAEGISLVLADGPSADDLTA